MMVKKLSILFITQLLSYCCHAQKADTIIITQAYTSYYSFELKDPIMVVYHLYKGGGNCSRKGFSFKTAELGKKGATSKDYAGSNYDKGHLANAEDFAYDCTLDELTFRYWNCYPQTKKLNRGIWKTMENQIRKESQTDSLVILSGGIYNQHKIIGNGVAVPDSCWKIVYSHSRQKILLTAIFSNTDNPVQTEITIQTLEHILHTRYGIQIKHWLN